MLPALAAIGMAGQFASNLMGAYARREEAREQVRSLKMEKQSALSSVLARSAGSGVEVNNGEKTTSVEGYLRRMASEYDREIRNMNRSADMAFMASIFGATAQAGGQAASIYGQSGPGTGGVEQPYTWSSGDF